MISTVSDTSDRELAIPGVEFKLLKTFPDQRGFFREVIRVTDPIFQPVRVAPVSPNESSHPVGNGRESSSMGPTVSAIGPTVSGPSSIAQSPFAQWSHSKMGLNTVKAWHFHHRQIDWWYVGLGVLHVALIDFREESPTYRRKMEFLLGESEGKEGVIEAVVKIPQGVLHGCKVITETAHLFYITSQTYDPSDEGRYPYNSSDIAHSWGEPCTVSENDCRTFIPTYERVRSLP